VSQNSANRKLWYHSFSSLSKGDILGIEANSFPGRFNSQVHIRREVKELFHLNLSRLTVTASNRNIDISSG
jgi:hypothetical protein